MMAGLKTVHGSDVLYREWEIENPSAVFLLVHGLGAHSGRWEFFANYTMQYGFSSYAIELKGFGRTRQKKGHIDSLDIYEKDICKLRDILLEKNPGKKIFLLGESLGGLITFLTVLKNPDKFDGLICMSPAFQSKIKFSFLDYLKIVFAMMVNSGKEFNIPITKEMCTRDIGYQAMLDTNHSEHRIGTAKLLLEIGRGQLYSYLHKNKFNKDLLFLLAGKDKLVKNDVARKIYKGINKNNKEIIEYPEMYHALSVEIERNKVFRDIVTWVESLIG